MRFIIIGSGRVRTLGFGISIVGAVGSLRCTETALLYGAADLLWIRLCVVRFIGSNVSVYVC